MSVLLGRTTAGTTADFNVATHTTVWDFVASASGQMQIIKAQTKVANPTATNVRLGIYANSAGAPGALLAAQVVDDLTAARGTGVFQATLPSAVTINSGTTYWLGWHAETEDWNFQGDSAGNYKETTGSSDFGDPFPASAAGNVNAIIWGEEGAAPEAQLPRTIQKPMRRKYSYQ